MDTQRRQDWILGIGGSELNDVHLFLYKNKTVDEMKQTMVCLVSEDCYREAETWGYNPSDHENEKNEDIIREYAKCDGMTESVDEVTETKIYEHSEDVMLSAYIWFREYHLDYTAQPLDTLREKPTELKETKIA